jgi:hypothetical protein
LRSCGNPQKKGARTPPSIVAAEPAQFEESGIRENAASRERLPGLGVSRLRHRQTWDVAS